MAKAWGLVVAANAPERAALEADLRDSGHEVASFATCRHALDWLDEETPRAAVLKAAGDADFDAVFQVLSERGVGMVAGLVLVANIDAPAPAPPTERPSPGAPSLFVRGPAPRAEW